MGVINYFFAIISTLLLVIGLVVIYRKLVTSKEENNLILKLIGYYFLGGFNFKFNTFPVPVGFLAFLLFFRPTQNSNAKRASAYLGLLAFLVSLIPVPLANYLFEKPREVALSSTNIYSMDVKKDWQTIRQKNQIPEGTKLENYEIHYNPNGQIRELSFEVIGWVDGKLTHYQVDMMPSKKVYQVRAHRIQQWLQYDKLIIAEHFFGLLGNLDLKKLKPEQSFEWYGLRCNGWLTNYEMKDPNKFLIKDGDFIKIENSELPITGIYYLSSYGMLKVKDSPSVKQYEAVDTTDYLF